ncbi:CDC27 family protein [Flavobacteriaceae bacterium 3-367]
MKYTLIFIVLIFSLSCTEKQGSDMVVTRAADYDRYLDSPAPKTTSKYFELWNSKIKPDSMQLTSFGIVAGQYNSYFQATGDIAYLQQAEQALKRACTIAAVGKADYYRALARNYISQHRFREALEWAQKAQALGSGDKETQGLLFDLHMELGDHDQAEHALNSIRNTSDFGYLIRAAKWNDHLGDLATTLRFMEMAKTKAEASKNNDLRLWCYTNLGDYYGHAGNVRESYAQYLKALELDPGNAYAKKGIAWIVFSFERKPKEANRILNAITRHHKAPDYYLFKAEIAEYMGNEKEKQLNLDQYFETVKLLAYGEMYNAHNVSLYLDEHKAYDRAIALAEREVQNRPTPETYDLLAYSHFRNGDGQKALQLITAHVEGRTYEPMALYHMAEVYKEMGKETKVKELKKELMGAVYELGPLMENRIINL